MIVASVFGLNQLSPHKSRAHNLKLINKALKSIVKAQLMERDAVYVVIAYYWSRNGSSSVTPIAERPKGD